jgi:CRP-like cAMP-binding protein
MHLKNAFAIDSRLASTPLLACLDAKGLDRLGSAAREIHARKGEFLFYKGDPCHGIHLLLDGNIKLALPSPKGDEKVTDILGPGQSFGEDCMFSQQPYSVLAQALSKVEVIFISTAAVLAELEHSKDLTRHMLDNLASRTHQAFDDIESTTKTATRRTIDYLLGLLPENQPPDMAANIRLPAHKGLIASRLSISQEHFSRLLRDLQQLALISMQGNLIAIPNVHRLSLYQD